MTQLSYACTLFISLLITALPWLLLGIIVSSWLLVFVDEHQLVAKFPRNAILGAIVGSSLGMILPVCQYGNIPVVRRLLLQKVPTPVAVSFLIAAPSVNPIVIWATWRAFPANVSMVLYRLFFAWSIGIVIGIIFSAKKEKPLHPDVEVTPIQTRSSLLKSGTFLVAPRDDDPLHRVGNLVYEYKTFSGEGRPLNVSLNLFWENARRETLELGSVLLLGCAVTALVQVFFPQDGLLVWGQAPVRQIVVMMILAVVLSLGSIANGFFLSTVNPIFLKGSLLSFLLLGSIFDLKSLGLIFSAFRFKPAIYLLILGVQLVFSLALLLNFYF